MLVSKSFPPFDVSKRPNLIVVVAVTVACHANFRLVSYVKWLPRSPGCITSFGTTVTNLGWVRGQDHTNNEQTQSVEGII